MIDAIGLNISGGPSLLADLSAIPAPMRSAACARRPSGKQIASVSGVPPALDLSGEVFRE
jgi:hypothetical protein